jgi:two-component system response regulator AtoC
MIGAVKILVISEDNDVCSLIRSSLESAGQNAICVSSPLQALELLERGLEASLLLVHATRDRSKDSSLLRRFSKQ